MQLKRRWRVLGPLLLENSVFRSALLYDSQTRVFSFRTDIANATDEVGRLLRECSEKFKNKKFSPEEVRSDATQLQDQRSLLLLLKWLARNLPEGSALRHAVDGRLAENATTAARGAKIRGGLAMIHQRATRLTANTFVLDAMTACLKRLRAVGDFLQTHQVTTFCFLWRHCFKKKRITWKRFLQEIWPQAIAQTLLCTILSIKG